MSEFRDIGGDTHLGAQLLEASCKAAASADKLLSTGEVVVSSEAKLAIMQHLLRQATLFERAGGTLLPEHHLLFHLVHELGWHGHPRAYSTYRDESLNGVIRTIARACYRLGFYDRVLQTFSTLQDSGGSVAMH
jgi:hypothetical protein